MAIEKKAKETAPAPSDKQKALETAISQIEKQFGKGAVMRLGQNATMNVEAIPTGSLSLDMGTGHRRPAPRQNRRDLWAGIQR